MLQSFSSIWSAPPFVLGVYLVVSAFLLSMIGFPLFIALFRKRAKQVIREDGPKTHLSKQGTPTMGGFLWIFVSSAVILFGWQKAWTSDEFILSMQALFALWAFALIGFWDDLKKIRKNNIEGLRAYQKLGLQLLVAVLFISMLVWLDPNASIWFGKLWIPIFNHIIELPFALMACFYVLVLLGSVNSVNLADGLDGLAVRLIVASLVVFSVYGFAYLTGINFFGSDALFYALETRGSLSFLSLAMIGGALGFLWFNQFPARIFMGDTGSMGFGGFLGVLAILLKIEILYVFFGLIYVSEALSVMIQVGYFKFKGKRVFRMAPLHHHFELGGMHESRVTQNFSLIAWLLAMLSCLPVFWLIYL